MEPSEFKISISVESYDEKTAENDQNCYVAEKRSFQTFKDIDPKFKLKKLKAWMKIVLKLNVPILYISKI